MPIPRISTASRSMLGQETGTCLSNHGFVCWLPLELVMQKKTAMKRGCATVKIIWYVEICLHGFFCLPVNQGLFPKLSPGREKCG